MTDQPNQNSDGQSRMVGPPSAHGAVNGEHLGFNNMQWKGGPVNNGPFTPANFPPQNINGLSSQPNTSQGAGFQITASVPSTGPPMMNGPSSRPPLGMVPQLNRPDLPQPTQGQVRPLGPPQAQPNFGGSGQQRMTQIPPVSSSSLGQIHLGQGPPSQKSSRTSSPSTMTGQNFDALEGQFTDQADVPAVKPPSTQWGPGGTLGPTMGEQKVSDPSKSVASVVPSQQVGNPRFSQPPNQYVPAQGMGMSPSNVPNQRPGFPPPANQIGAPARPGFPPMPSTAVGQNRPAFAPIVAPGQRPGFPGAAQTGGQRPGFPLPPSTSSQMLRQPNPAVAANQQPGFPPPPISTNQQPGAPPPANQHHGFPPHPSTSTQHPGFPPAPPISINQQPGFPPPPISTNQQPPFPTQNMTNQRPGFPPPPISTNQQSGFMPPQGVSQVPGFPPPPTSSQPGGSVPSQQPGFPPPRGPSQHPRYPTPPTSSSQIPGFNQNQPGGFGPRQPMNQTLGKSVGEFVNTYGNADPLSSNLGSMSIQGSQNINLLQQKQLIPPEGVKIPKPVIPNDTRSVNCNPEVFRCTLNAIPQTSALLSKARLPLGILIHPFKDLAQLPVIQSSVIVRCRKCRTYINPFVYFVDNRRWKCNLCFCVNELPDEFSFDPASKTYGDPQRRPEIKSATIEFIAPSEYMLRPPQPAVYLYLLDVSFNAVETGYLNMLCETLLDVIDKIPGDSRTQIGFIAYDSAVHFFNLAENLSRPQMLTVGDIDDIFLPCPDDLLVNLHACKTQVTELLSQLPSLFQGNMETRSALGAALQAAYKMMSSTGGRVTVMQTILPNVGPGALQNREDSTQKSGKDSQNLGPAIDFYKKLSLDCSAQQIAVDVFMFNGQYADLASIECISKFSAGCMYYYPSYHSVRAPHLVEKFEVDLRRYLTRKIGFESVMRIRCTRGISIHTFHGNFFVRSTDLLALPNVNPDAGFGMQMSIEDSLVESSTMCFQAALLYTSSKGERRIRVHTLCLPITNQLSDIYANADQQAIIDLVSKMAVDRSISSSLSDAREAIGNAAIDTLNAYGSTLPSGQRMGGLAINEPLRLMPMYCLALLKSIAFRSGTPTKLDDRAYALHQCKTLPTVYLLQQLYPHLYPVHKIMEVDIVKKLNMEVPDLPLLQLSSSNIDRHGAYLLDTGDNVYLYIGSAVNEQFCQDILGKQSYREIIEGGLKELPELDNEGSDRFRSFMTYLLDTRPNGISLYIVRDDGKYRLKFFQHFVEDRTESSLSYYEFLQHIQKQVKS